MILNLENFIKTERPYWEELEQSLDEHERNRGERLDLKQVRRFHYLYQRASSDLTQLKTFASEPELGRYLEAVVARAYTRLHGANRASMRFRPIHWFFNIWPQTFRRHAMAYWMAVMISMLGAAFGGFVLRMDVKNKALLMPAQFSHVLQSPSERVAGEEAAAASGASLSGNHAQFSASLMQNNIKVAINALAFGLLWGIGTILLLFYNGIILGVVCIDYIFDGQAVFLAAWLLPHGVPELTAIFMGGQGGLMLGRAIIGWGTNLGLRSRLRRIRDDLLTIIGGIVILLIWAGLIESYLSQHHEPVLSYSFKIMFGLFELVLLYGLLAVGGRFLAKES